MISAPRWEKLISDVPPKLHPADPFSVLFGAKDHVAFGPTER
jgi:hypothetical protein